MPHMLDQVDDWQSTFEKAQCLHTLPIASSHEEQIGRDGVHRIDDAV
jgi:hypothetical protein